MSKQTSPSKLAEALKLQFNTDEQLWLSNGYTLRTLIGVLGMSLPILLTLYIRANSHYTVPLESISHYYYTRAGSIFTIVVSLLAVFLIIYKGKEPIDFYLSLIAGLTALVMLLFPTSNLCEQCSNVKTPYCVTVLPAGASSENRALVHYIAAAVFLLCLAFMSLFLFTRSRSPLKQRSKGKMIRNWIYIFCGSLMIAALLVAFLGGFLELIPSDVYNRYHLTFWMETVAIEAFGLSWLIKGEWIIKD